MKDSGNRGSGHDRFSVCEPYEGQSLTVQCSHVFGDKEEAKAAYVKARSRFLDINHWDRYAKDISAHFQLFDAEGNKWEGVAKKGLLVRIDVPWPGTGAGNDYNWVVVEDLEEEQNDQIEYVAFRVRPSQNPESREEDIAHFYTDESTGTLVLRKEDERLIGVIYERNLTPNPDVAEEMDDATEGTIVGDMATMGLTREQWQDLIRSILD